ncbi:WXG100 family type VII secretion target [Nocardia stercoris]|uniref:ESAT-6-like protein n=1 Tax=Nocardia stercoris TaxID=2483361 RepID=A0A3M2LC82_9NOCA|nr:WXG100 family type VII secretion target [Nocardia stercoris]RMI35162.1 WXG100 family type VII secretion target [Nocardia stercoris]
MTNPGGNTELSVVPDEVKTVGKYAADLAEVLQNALSRVDTEVQSLLKGGWSGDAATHFSKGWTDCQTGGKDTFEALADIASKLGSAASGFDEKDNQFASELSTLDLPPVG